MRDFIAELDEIKTAFRGYDKEEMMLYIRELLQFCEEEKKRDMDRLLEQSDTLRRELDEAKSREDTIRGQYDALLERFEQLSEAMQENARYHARRDEQLDAFHRQQEEMERTARETKEQAERERERLLEQAQQECDRYMLDARRQSEHMLAEAQEKKRRLQAEADYLRCTLDETAEKLGPILFGERSGLCRQKTESVDGHGHDCKGL